jgi:hypothetical protein
VVAASDAVAGSPPMSTGGHSAAIRTLARISGAIRHPRGSTRTVADRARGTDHRLEIWIVQIVGLGNPAPVPRRAISLLNRKAIEKHEAVAVNLR